jgi:hypothetical protein
MAEPFNFFNLRFKQDFQDASGEAKKEQGSTVHGAGIAGGTPCPG